MKKAILAASLSVALTACSTQTTSHSTQQTAPSPKSTSTHSLSSHPIPTDLDFSKLKGVSKSFTLNGQTIKYRAFENIVYVLKPVDTRYQVMNIYIPEAYFTGNNIDGFTAQTAPIFLPNNIGGYMPAEAGKPEINARSGEANAIMVALSKGYVVASPGARGRTESNGRAPAAIIDLKAAVRYLYANDQSMPGDAKKIISNGTSAGGALSALLAASGDAPEYLPYLNALGAAQTSDRIFAASVYCPITNLEHADMAYEWQFNGINDYQKIDISMLDYNVERKLVKGTQTAEQIALSNQLKPLFPAYVNSLKLKNAQGEIMHLDADGNGSFKKQIESMLIQSAQTALNAGQDLSAQKWLTIRNGKAVAADFDGYAKFVGRQKTAPAFDGVDLSTGENNLFGDQTIDKKHFTPFAMTHNTAQNAQMADSKIIHLMNAMNFTANPNGAQHYRIRVGENDRDTSLAISTLLALQLQNQHKNVDFAFPWGIPHSGDYDLNELFAWTKKISSH